MPLFPSAALISSSSSSKSKNHEEIQNNQQSATDSWLNIGSSYQQPLVDSGPAPNADQSLLSSVANSTRSEEPTKQKRKHKKDQRSDKEHKKKKKDKHGSKKKKHKRSDDQDATKDVIKDENDRDYSSSDWSSDDEKLFATSASSSSSAAAAAHTDRERRRDHSSRLHSSIQQQVVVHGKQTAPTTATRDIFFLPDGRVLLTTPKQTETTAPNAELYYIDRRADKDLLTFGHYRLDIPNYVLSTDRGIRPLAHLVKHSHQLPRYDHRRILTKYYIYYSSSQHTTQLWFSSTYVTILSISRSSSFLSPVD